MQKLKDMGLLDSLAYILLIFAGISGGLLVFNFNLIEWIGKALNFPIVITFLYGAIGLAAIYAIFMLFKQKR